MALWHCAGCGADYSVGAPFCPQCGSTDRTEDDMPKISIAGPSGGTDPVPAAATAHGGAVAPAEGAEQAPEDAQPGPEAGQPPSVTVAPPAPDDLGQPADPEPPAEPDVPAAAAAKPPARAAAKAPPAPPPRKAGDG